MFWNKTKVNFIKELDTTGKWWCDSAVMFTVKNGRNVIREVIGPDEKDYNHLVYLQVGDKPLIQSDQPSCPTCKSLLATGYGIENIDCPELVAAREAMNSEFVSLMDSAEKIKPLLGLLSDGYYVLADVICFPSDGDGHFFYEVPDEPKYYEAACDGYYSSFDYSIYDHFPLFLYPSQSSLLISNKRVEYYAQILKTENNPPRALAYHFTGFMNLLLDGHHKACAAASLGKAIRCLTIIPMDGCLFVPGKFKAGENGKPDNPLIKSIHFAGLEVIPEEEMYYRDVFADRWKRSDIYPIRKYSLTENRIHYGPDLYPTIRDFAQLMNTEVNGNDMFPDMSLEALLRLTDENTDDVDRFLEAALHYLTATDQDKAYKLASAIVKKGKGHKRGLRLMASFQYLLNCKSDETEQLFADFYVNHNASEHDEYMEIVNSYWRDGNDSGTQ